MMKTKIIVHILTREVINELQFYLVAIIDI